jgi:hypothetical protein
MVPRHALVRHGLLLTLLLVLCFGAAATPASAEQHSTRPDSAAPAGSAPSWLPQEAWVLQRWVPFDEPALERRLRMDTSAIAQSLDASGATLAGLARARGVPTKGLAERLVASRRLPAGSPLRAVLLRRTRRVLSQSHLAVHLLSHVFHTWTVTRDTEDIFGVPQARVTQLYQADGLSMQAIAAQGGVALARLRARALKASVAAGRAGRAVGALSVTENRILRARDRRNFASWAAYRVPRPTSARAASVAAPTHLALCLLG